MLMPGEHERMRNDGTLIGASGLTADVFQMERSDTGKHRSRAPGSRGEVPSATLAIFARSLPVPLAEIGTAWWGHSSPAFRR